MPSDTKPNDPRRPSAERTFKLTLPQEDVDYMAMLGLLFGMMGLLLKFRVFVWQALICCVMSAVNMKTTDFDFKQLFSTFSIAVMGLIMAYVGPQAKYFQ